MGEHETDRGISNARWAAVRELLQDRARWVRFTRTDVEVLVFPDLTTGELATEILKVVDEVELQQFNDIVCQRDEEKR